jgi:hypothetical protein
MKAELNITQLTDTENLSEIFSAKLASTFRALQYRNYRLFFFGQIISGRERGCSGRAELASLPLNLISRAVRADRFRWTVSDFSAECFRRHDCRQSGVHGSLILF